MRGVLTKSLAGSAVFVCALASALQPIAVRAGIPERLHWVRGTVAAIERDSAVTQLRGRTLRVAIDQSTEVMLVRPDGVIRAARPIPATAYLTLGDAIEVHYRDGGPDGVARYIWVGVPMDADSISKKPEQSAAGSLADVKAGHWLLPPRFTVVSGRDHRIFRVESSTRLMDTHGVMVAAKTRLPPGRDAMGGANERVVVIYRTNRSKLYARVIRTLP